MPRGPGKIQKKILMLLAGGVSLAFASFSPKGYFRTLRQIGKELDKVNRKALIQSINQLYQSKLISYKENKDGTVRVVLNDTGKKRALIYSLDNMKIKSPKRWDRRWRIVIFDVPHPLKKARDALRRHLNHLGFYQLQKSVFVHPFECEDEIDFLVEIYNMRRFVRKILAESIDNARELKEYFDVP